MTSGPAAPPAEPPRPAGTVPVAALAALVTLQLAVGAIVFGEFMRGDKHFAYLDIGSDTWSYYLPMAMHLADYVRSEGWPGWSFSIGLGAAMFPAWDPFVWPYLLVGSDNVLAARIWVFMAKLLLAGWAMYALLRSLDRSPAASAILALAYTFCGYALVNAQWDLFAAELVFYPLVLRALLGRLRGAASWKLAVVVALAIAAQVFVVSLLVFVVWVFVGSAALSGGPQAWKAQAGRWLRRIAPPCIGGLLLAAPVWIPQAFLLADSPRVGGAQALFAEQLSGLLAPAGREQWLALIAGFFHKDLLHVGNAYRGWSNYLEAPVFYVGMAALVLLPQWWRAGAMARRALCLGAAFLAAYCTLPALAHMAFAFAVPYYRTSNLWVGILLLLLAAHALDRVLRHGVDRPLLLAAGIVWSALPLLLWGLAGERVWTEHLVRIEIAVVATAALLAAASWHGWRGGRARPLLVGLAVVVSVEAAWVGRASFHHGRDVATPQGASYSDGSLRALEAIRRNDPGLYRIEKRIPNLFLNDALAQAYFGIASYHAYNGSSPVRLYVALGLLPERHAAVNYTNWLAAPGERFALYSLFGTRYLIAAGPVEWPGFVAVGRVGPLAILRNDAALPLAVLHHRQIAYADFLAAPLELRDFAMFHAVVADSPVAGLPGLPMAALGPVTKARLRELYFDPAASLQRRGMIIESFSHNRLSGRVAVPERGVLVASIPYSPGWQARVDGREVRPFRANLGMLALALEAGASRVELAYRQPGLAAGTGVAALGALLLCAAAARRGFRRRHAVE